MGETMVTGGLQKNRHASSVLETAARERNTAQRVSIGPSATAQFSAYCAQRPSVRRFAHIRPFCHGRPMRFPIAGDPIALTHLVPGELVNLRDGSSEDVVVGVDLPTCHRVPKRRGMYAFARNGVEACIYRRRWRWYIAVGDHPERGLHKTEDASLAQALWVAECHIDRFYFSDGTRRPCPEGHVYFLQSVRGGPIKVGYAADLRARVSNIQVGHPEELEVIGVVRGTPELEEALHKEFAWCHVRGEWFAPSEALRLAIDDLEERDELGERLVDVVRSGLFEEEDCDA
jgi:hypothetical protein